MNIYLDIDGVLKGNCSPKEDIESLVCHCIENHRSSVYWLTTHCRGGINRVKEALDGEFAPELVKRMVNIFGDTDWNILKTEAIDFSKPFVWLDDTVFGAELGEMEEKMPHGACYGLFLMDKTDPFSARDALEYIKEVEKRLQ